MHPGNGKTGEKKNRGKRDGVKEKERKERGEEEEGNAVGKIRAKKMETEGMERRKCVEVKERKIGRTGGVAD